MDELEGYDEEIRRGLALLEEKIEQADRMNPEKRQNLVRGIESLLNETKINYKSFMVCYNELLQEDKVYWDNTRKKYQASLNQLAIRAKDIKNEQDRADFGLGENEKTTAEILSEASRIQDESIMSIDRTKRVLGETIEVAAATSQQLRADNEKLGYIQEDLHEVNNELSLAQRQLKSLLVKLAKDKLTL